MLLVQVKTLDIEGGTNCSTVVSDNKIIINSVNTQYAVGDGGLSQNNFTNADHTKLNAISPSANNYSFLINGQSNRWKWYYYKR